MTNISTPVNYTVEAGQVDFAGPKIVHGMSNEEYHSRPELSSSQLKLINAVLNFF